MIGPVRPSKWLRFVAEALVRGPGREFVLGDLEELYAWRAAARGRHRAVVRYLVEVVVSAWAGVAEVSGTA